MLLRLLVLPVAFRGSSMATLMRFFGMNFRNMPLSLPESSPKAVSRFMSSSVSAAFAGNSVFAVVAYWPFSGMTSFCLFLSFLPVSPFAMIISSAVMPYFWAMPSMSSYHFTTCERVFGFLTVGSAACIGCIASEEVSFLYSLAGLSCFFSCPAFPIASCDGISMMEFFLRPVSRREGLNLYMSSMLTPYALLME